MVCSGIEVFDFIGRGIGLGLLDMWNEHILIAPTNYTTGVSFIDSSNIKEHIAASHYCPFVSGIHVPRRKSRR